MGSPRMPDRASLRGQARLRSCVVPTAGNLFTARAIAFDDTLAFNDEPLAAAVRWRLGMQQSIGLVRRCKRYLLWGQHLGGR